MAYKEEIGAAYYMAEEFEFLEDYPQLYKDMLNLTDFRIFKDKLNMVGGNIDKFNQLWFRNCILDGYVQGQKQDGTMIMIILSMSYATLRVPKHFI